MVEKMGKQGYEHNPRVLKETNLLHSDDSDPMFDRFTSLAKRLFNVSIALITVLDGDFFWIKSNEGMPGVSEFHKSECFCSYTIMDYSPDVFVVKDATKDERFKNNSRVKGPPYARFYAGKFTIFSLFFCLLWLYSSLIYFYFFLFNFRCLLFSCSVFLILFTLLNMLLYSTLALCFLVHNFIIISCLSFFCIILSFY